MTINVQSAADPTQKHEYEGVRPFGWWTVSASLQSSSLCTIADTDLYLYWNGQLVWTPALALYLCVGDRGLCPAGFIAHLRLYRHIRQAAIPVLETGFIAHL